VDEGDNSFDSRRPPSVIKQMSTPQGIGSRRDGSQESGYPSEGYGVSHSTPTLPPRHGHAAVGGGNMFSGQVRYSFESSIFLILYMLLFTS